MSRPTASQHPGGGSAGPRLSIGLPVYNGERFLEDAITDTLAQSFDDFELILADNASTDRSVEICRDFAARDPRVRFHGSDENRGAAWNFNRCFELGRAPFFKWTAHDDRLEPDFLRRCVEALDADPEAVLAFTRAVQVDARNEVTRPLDLDLRGDSPSTPRRFREQANLDHRCIQIFGVIRREALLETDLIGAYVNSDRVLLAHLALLGKLLEVPEVLFRHREHQGRSTRAFVDMRERVRWFDPAQSGSLTFPHWRVFGEYLSLVGRVELPPSERTGCGLQLARWAFRHAGVLAGELRGVGTQLLGQIAGRSEASS